MAFAVPRHRAAAGAAYLPEPGAATFALSDLSPGTSGRITRLLDDGVGGALVRRLRNLGFVPGRIVTPLRRAPLGDPIVYRIADYELCLRRHEACIVQVEAVTEADDITETKTESVTAPEAETSEGTALTEPSTEATTEPAGEEQHR